MLGSVTLTNTGAAILFCLAFAGLWHIIGVPPIATWGKSKKGRENVESLYLDRSQYGSGPRMGEPTGGLRKAPRSVSRFDHQALRPEGDLARVWSRHPRSLEPSDSDER